MSAGAVVDCDVATVPGGVGNAALDCLGSLRTAVAGEATFGDGFGS